ncbi:hypothetical protein TNCV_4182731 [Trichonephila clavipes]|nr:hypothetical protein TNCV_4182731 [Trichonephila clavipes]
MGFSGKSQRKLETTDVDDNSVKTRHICRRETIELEGFHQILKGDYRFTQDVKITSLGCLSPVAKAGVEVQLLTVSSCPVVDKENDLIFCRSSKFKTILLSKPAVGRPYDTEVLLFVDLTIDRS